MKYEDWLEFTKKRESNSMDLLEKSINFHNWERLKQQGLQGDKTAAWAALKIAELENRIDGLKKELNK